MFFSRAVGTLLDKYLLTRGQPRSGPLFVTQRKARLPRRADLTPDGYARLSYRQADTLWKKYTPDWDLHQLRHTAISVQAAHDYTEVDLKRFSGHTSLRSLERYIADNRAICLAICDTMGMGTEESATVYPRCWKVLISTRKATSAGCLSGAAQNLPAPGIHRCTLLGAHAHRFAYCQADGLPGHRSGPDQLRSLRDTSPSSPGHSDTKCLTSLQKIWYASPAFRTRTGAVQRTGG